MTRLRIELPSALIGDMERPCLVEVDMSGLGGFPEGMRLSDSWFLKRVRMPSRVNEIPAGMFACCYELAEIDLEVCHSLTRIGRGAFQYCWELRKLVVPERCGEIDVSYSGVDGLDLRWVSVSQLRAGSCWWLRRLILRWDFRGMSAVDHDVGMRMTMGEVVSGRRRGSWLSGSLEEVRYLSYRVVGFVSCWVDEMGEVAVFGEVVSLAVHNGRPALPG
jgi:hypothetical protein